jgi:hypothetical protein
MATSPEGVWQPQVADDEVVTVLYLLHHQRALAKKTPIAVMAMIRNRTAKKVGTA